MKAHRWRVPYLYKQMTRSVIGEINSVAQICATSPELASSSDGGSCLDPGARDREQCIAGGQQIILILPTTLSNPRH